MANIMLTDVCNLRCPYCFANEFVNHGVNEIDIENFKKALDFVATEPNAKLGLIGGEPTLHSKFKEILQLLIADDRFHNIVLFTNGVRVDEFANELAHPKFHILLNCNSPKDMGEHAYEKMCNNLDMLIRSHYMKDRITLGINIYQNNFQYDYILELLKKYNYNHVRMSIVVPNTSEKRDFNVKRYFLDIKPKFKEFVYAMLSNNIIPTYDCNKMPACLLTEEEYKTFDALIKKKQKERELAGLPPIHLPMNDSAIYTDVVHCSPVVDIRQDLTAVRCFGLSDCTKTSITDFKSLPDLRNYYTNEIDSYAYRFGISDDCMECYRRKTLRCTGGCIAFKIAQIMELKECMEKSVRGLKNGK